MGWHTRRPLGGHRNTHGLVKGGTKIRCVSGHIPHHATIPETNDILTGWSGHLGMGKLIIGMDANEVFTQPFTTTANSSTGRGERVLQWASEHSITFPLQDVNTPTHFPYNTRLTPRRPDHVACRSTSHKQGGVVACRHRAATDHDGVKLTLQLNIEKNRDSSEVVTWGPRRLKLEGVVERTLCQPAPRAQDPRLSIANAVKAITKPGRTTLKYSESPELKQLRRAARNIPPGEEAKQAWKQVKKTKEQERKRWLQQKADEAAQLSWGRSAAFNTTSSANKDGNCPALTPRTGKNSCANISGGSSRWQQQLAAGPKTRAAPTVGTYHSV